MPEFNLVLRLRELLDVPAEVFPFSDRELDLLDNMAVYLLDGKGVPSRVDILKLLQLYRRYKARKRRKHARRTGLVDESALGKKLAELNFE